MECPSCLAPAGEACDDPRDLCGQPIGQYHCPGCGVMQVACLPHIDCDDCGGTHTVDAFTCPRCGKVSYNPNDLREGYCGHCHDWTGTPA